MYFEHRLLVSQDVKTSIIGVLVQNSVSTYQSSIYTAVCNLHKKFDLTIISELLPPLLSFSASSSTSLHPQLQDSLLHYPHWHSCSHHHSHLHDIFTVFSGLIFISSTLSSILLSNVNMYSQYLHHHINHTHTNICYL